MLSADGNFVISFNGELYNFAQLRNELEALGVRFRSTGDTEVVLYALILWGVEALGRFNGMFALAFYNIEERSLILARDHAGIKPLYYLQHKHGIAYASQFDQILSHPWSRESKVAYQSLSLYLHMAFIPAPFTILENCALLEPGSWVKFESTGNVAHGKYFEFPIYEPATLRGEEATEALDAALSNAVERQLVSDVPVAAFLSGGIDSPLVLSKMLQTGNGPFRAFTIGTEDVASDEANIAVNYARQLDVQHTVQRIAEADALGMLSEVVKASSEPFGDYSIFPTMLVSRLAASEFKVILSGDGGDELLWGYVQRMAEAIQLAPSFTVSPKCRQIQWSVRRLLGKHRAHHHLRFTTPGQWHAFKHLLLRGNHLARIFPDLPPWPEDYKRFDYSPYDANETRTAQWIRWNEFTTHLTKVLLKVDRASMHESLEVRVPILDREVVQTAQQIDWQSCLDIEDGIGKLPLRKMLSKSVNHQSTAKRGFEVPMGAWLRGSLRELVHDVVLSQDEFLGMPVNRKRMNALFAQHESGQINMAQGLWPIVSLALWEREHFNR